MSLCRVKVSATAPTLDRARRLLFTSSLGCPAPSITRLKLDRVKCKRRGVSYPLCPGSVRTWTGWSSLSSWASGLMERGESDSSSPLITALMLAVHTPTVRVWDLDTGGRLLTKMDIMRRLPTCPLHPPTLHPSFLNCWEMSTPVITGLDF